MNFARLKQQTQPHHDRLEAHPLTAQLMQPSLTHKQYLHTLIAFYGYYAAVEEQFAHWERTLPTLDLPNRYKSQQLAHDIHTLDAAVQVADVPLCADLPPCQTPAEVFGCLYVLEGATLGGQIIARHITNQLHLSATAGLCFFKGYGAQTGAMWLAFRAAVAQCVPDEQTETEVIEAACQTFATFESWLTHYG